MKHTIMNKLKSFFGASLVLFLLASCNNTTANNGSKNQVAVNGNITIQGFENILPSQLLAGLNKKKAARTITTNFEQTKEEFDGTFYYLIEAVEVNETATDPKKYEKNLSIDKNEFSFLLDSSIDTWNFQLKLIYEEEANGGGTNKVIIMSSPVITKALADLTASDAEEIPFILYPVVTTDSSTGFGGNLNLTIEDATGSDGQAGYISYVTIKNNATDKFSQIQNTHGLKTFEETYTLIKGSTDIFDINFKDVAPGNYSLEFSFYKKGSAIPVYSFTEAVSVYPLFVTNTILKKSGPHINEAIDDNGVAVYSIKITDELVQNYKQKEQNISDTGTMLYQTKKVDGSSLTTYFYSDADNNSVQYNDAIDYTFDSKGYVYVLHNDGKTITSNNPHYPTLTIVPTDLNDSTFTKATGIEMDTASDSLYAYNNETTGKFEAVYSPLKMFADDYYFTVSTDYSQTIGTDFIVENIAVYNGTIYALFHGSGYPYKYRVAAINSIDGSVTNDAVIKKTNPNSETEPVVTNVLDVFGIYSDSITPKSQISDMIYMDSALYFIVNQYGINVGSGYTDSGAYGYKPGIFSRGALVRVSSLTSKYPEIAILGWTDDKADAELTQLSFTENGTTKYGLCSTNGNGIIYVQDDPDIPVVGGNAENLKPAGLDIYFTENEIWQAINDANEKALYPLNSSTVIYSPQTIDSYFAGGDFYGSSCGFYGPQKFVALKPKKLLIADDGLAVYVDVDNFWCYKNVNRIVTVDLEEFAITEAAETDVSFTNNKDGALPLYGNASGFAAFPFNYEYKDSDTQTETYIMKFPSGCYDSSGYSLNENTHFYLTLRDADSEE